MVQEETLKKTKRTFTLLYCSVHWKAPFAVDGFNDINSCVLDVVKQTHHDYDDDYDDV